MYPLFPLFTPSTPRDLDENTHGVTVSRLKYDRIVTLGREETIPRFVHDRRREALSVPLYVHCHAYQKEAITATSITKIDLSFDYHCITITHLTTRLQNQSLRDIKTQNGSRRFPVNLQTFMPVCYSGIQLQSHRQDIHIAIDSMFQCCGFAP